MSGKKGMMADVYRLLMTKPDGMRRTAIAEVVGRSPDCVGYCLRTLCKRGIVTRSSTIRGDPRTLWKAVPGHNPDEFDRRGTIPASLHNLTLCEYGKPWSDERYTRLYERKSGYVESDNPLDRAFGLKAPTMTGVAQVRTHILRDDT